MSIDLDAINDDEIDPNPKDYRYVESDLREEIADLRAENGRLAAIIQAVEKLHPKVQRGSGDHFYCDPDECDRAGEGSLIDVCGECRQLWPCTTVVALSSPVSLSELSGGSV